MEKVKEFIQPRGHLALAPCPFCGSNEIVYGKYDHAAGERYMAFCLGCTAQIDPGWAQTPEAVQDLWNRRA